MGQKDPEVSQQEKRYLVWMNGYAADGGATEAGAVAYAQEREARTRVRNQVTEHAGTLEEVTHRPASTKTRDVEFEHKDQS